MAAGKRFAFPVKKDAPRAELRQKTKDLQEMLFLDADVPVYSAALLTSFQASG